VKEMHLWSEKEWQRAICNRADWLGWHWYHTHDSRRSPAGFPDLVLVRRDRLIFAELKTDKGRVRPPQHHWLQLLEQTMSEVYVWRPRDYDHVLEVLK
jgi:hypothetical protein